MSTRAANVALLSTIPEEAQHQIYVYLTQNFCKGNPYKPKSSKDIYADLDKSRACYERGEFEDFDDVLNGISEKYDL